MNNFTFCIYTHIKINGGILGQEIKGLIYEQDLQTRSDVADKFFSFLSL
jgi:hypothetical protein